MKTHRQRVLVLTALMAATVCAAPTVARRGEDPALQVSRETIRVNIVAPARFEVERRDGKVVTMSAVKKDGGRAVLKATRRPVCATTCPAGQTLTCWEDQQQMMSICECRGGGGGSFKFFLTVEALP
ncbi:MAG TPA: hypothetical protein VJV03_15095 [Pyrinomonadaceae bacterium]|nr:hypothetical protein [Pyrinomonadaceae bacterium]